MHYDTERLKLRQQRQESKLIRNMQFLIIEKSRGSQSALNYFHNWPKDKRRLGRVKP